MLANGQGERPAIAPKALLFVFIALLYIALIGRYNAYDVDSRWFPSFSHAFVSEHIQTDPSCMVISQMAWAVSSPSAN